MNNRLKEVREALSTKLNKKVSRQFIANDLEISVNTIESYELGRRNPSGAFIKLFCDRYNVNDEWLRTGQGDMFKPLDREQEIAEITRAMLKGEGDDFILKVSKALSELSPEAIEKANEFFKKIFN